MRTEQDIINRKEANQRYYKLEENKEQKRNYVQAHLLKSKYDYETDKFPSLEDFLVLIPKCFERFDAKRKQLNFSSNKIFVAKKFEAIFWGQKNCRFFFYRKKSEWFFRTFLVHFVDEICRFGRFFVDFIVVVFQKICRFFFYRKKCPSCFSRTIFGPFRR